MEGNKKNQGVDFVVSCHLQNHTIRTNLQEI